MLAREMLAVREANGLHHLDIRCLPAAFHNHPDRIAPALDGAIRKARREGFQKVFVAYADCGSGGAIDRVCAEHGVERIPGPHCFAFYIGNHVFAERDAEADFVTTFFLTDFLVRHFDAFCWQPLGLDRHPELRDVYFGNYTRALHLAQTDDSALAEAARGCAERLGLRLETRRTGYGDLTPALADA